MKENLLSNFLECRGKSVGEIYSFWIFFWAARKPDYALGVLSFIVQLFRLWSMASLASYASIKFQERYLGKILPIGLLQKGMCKQPDLFQWNHIKKLSCTLHLSQQQNKLKTIFKYSEDWGQKKECLHLERKKKTLEKPQGRFYPILLNK